MHRYDAALVARDWTRLHAGDAEPPPSDPRLLDAWVLFHNGAFAEAAAAGLALGGAGMTVANKAACIYANDLEPDPQRRQALFLEVAQRAEQQARAEPDNPGAWYWQAYALGRYSQAVSVARALAQGLGGRVKQALERAIALQPLHADAHAALGTFHAEVIDKVGALIGGMTYGARKDAGLKLFADALRLHPRSPVLLREFGHALVMLEGEAALKEAQRLLRQAAATEPLDAKEWLDVRRARAELRD